MVSSHIFMAMIALGLIGFFLVKAYLDKKEKADKPPGKMGLANEIPPQSTSPKTGEHYPPSDHGKWVKIREAHNNMEADIINDYLKEHGIPVYIKGYNHRSMLGVAGSFISLDILVPENIFDKAQKLLKTIEEQHKEFENMDYQIFEGEEPEESPSMPAPQKPTTLRPRNWMIAVMLPLFMPGLGNLYARNNNLGYWLLTAGFVCYSAIFILLPKDKLSENIFLLLLISLISLIAIDMISACRYISKKKTG